MTVCANGRQNRGSRVGIPWTPLFVHAVEYTDYARREPGPHYLRHALAPRNRHARLLPHQQPARQPQRRPRMSRRHPASSAPCRKHRIPARADELRGRQASEARPANAGSGVPPSRPTPAPVHLCPLLTGCISHALRLYSPWASGALERASSRTSSRIIRRMPHGDDSLLCDTSVNRAASPPGPTGRTQNGILCYLSVMCSALPPNPASQMLANPSGDMVC